MGPSWLVLDVRLGVADVIGSFKINNSIVLRA
jgi:hypothetical protein